MVRNFTLAVLASLVLAGSAQAASPDITISQVYGGGGNSGATYTNDFIELYNRSGAAVAVDGWSVQYASAAGTTWQVTALSGSIPPGGHYLVQESAGTARHDAAAHPGRDGQHRDERHLGEGRAAHQHRGLRGGLPGDVEGLRGLRHGQRVRGVGRRADADQHDRRQAGGRWRDGHGRQRGRLHRRRARAAQLGRRGAGASRRAIRRTARTTCRSPRRSA